MASLIVKGFALIATATAATSISALPVIDQVAFFTETYGASVTFPTVSGDYLQLFTRVISSDAPEFVSAVATQGARVRPLTFFTGPIFTEKNFIVRLRDTSLTGAWDLTVTDSSGSATGIFPAIANPEILPLLQNVQVVSHGLTPTITWQLPDLNDFDVDFIRIRAVEADTGIQIFQSALLNPTSNSYTFGNGVLSGGVSYEFRLLLDDFDGTRLENRSNTFSSVYTAAVPEPSAVMLMLAGAGLLGVVSRRRRSRGT